MAHKAVRWVVALAVGCALPFVPIPEKLAPDWEVRVLDEQGKPVAGATVDESWQFVGVERGSQNRQSLTDAAGVVHIPAECGASSLAQRI